MKTKALLFLTLVLTMGTCGKLYGQNFVTDPQDEISRYFDSLQIKYSLDISTNGIEYLYFYDNQINVEYYFSGSTCIAYKMLFPHAGLKEAIDLLDYSFERIPGNMWQEYNGYQYFIWTLDESDKGYMISVELKSGIQK